jgi:hypothetical protein
MLLTYILNDFEMVPVAPIITGITLACTFHMRCISSARSLYLLLLLLLLLLKSACADCLEIWKPQLPGTPRACPDLYKNWFTFCFCGFPYCLRGHMFWDRLVTRRVACPYLCSYKPRSTLLSALPPVPYTSGLV